MYLKGGLAIRVKDEHCHIKLLYNDEALLNEYIMRLLAWDTTCAQFAGMTVYTMYYCLGTLFVIWIPFNINMDEELHWL